MKDVCAVSDLEPNKPLAVRVGTAEIVLAKWRDEVYAVRNTCPHQGQSFVCGTIGPRLTSTVPGAELVADDRNPVLMCPWHTWGFDLKTGRGVSEPTLRVRTYPVEIRDGRILVDI